MDPAEVSLARLSLQLASAAMQAAVTYNQAQATLDLENVVAGDRLTSRQGLAASRQTLAALAELTSRHKQMFSNFTTNATAQMLAAASELREERRAQVAEQLIDSLNWNLSLQSQFYEGREQWIKAASQALNLAEEHEGRLWLEDGGLVVDSDALLTELQALVAPMDQVREKEVAMFAERQARIAAAVSRLQAMA